MRRRRRARRPGRRDAGARRARRSAPTASSAAPRTRRSRPTRPTPTPTSTTWRSARSTRRRPSPAAPPPGLDYVAYAARTVSKPWFAIGGLDPTTLPAAVEAGARRAVVVRAITDADGPGSRRERAQRTARGRGWGSEAVSAARGAGHPRRSPTRGTRTWRTESGGFPRAGSRPRGTRPAQRPRWSRGYARSASETTRSEPALEPLATRRAPDRRHRRRGRRRAASPSPTSSSSSPARRPRASSRAPAALVFAASCSSPRSACGAASTGPCSASRCCSASRSSSPRPRAAARVELRRRSSALRRGSSPSAGPLFWFLIRAMARLQMPTRTR